MVLPFLVAGAAGMAGGGVVALETNKGYRKGRRRFYNKVGRFFRPKQARNIARRQARRRKLRRERRRLQTA